MKLRIISGKFGGRYIDANVSSKTHPMGERVRGALFNILGNLEGKIVVDAFAGTGAIGIEAISRGADKVMFIERDRIAQKIIKANLQQLNCAGQAEIINTSVMNWCETREAAEIFDLVIADPPYHSLQLNSVSRLADYMKSDGLMILSYPGKESSPQIKGARLVDNRAYGDGALAFYKKV
jgi:16S rRNA (guanine966-N2)-methyltransferase